MSALDDVLNYYTDQIDRTEGEQARAELAQTRAAAAEAQVAHVYLDESPVNGDADDTPIELADRIAVLVGDVIALRATVADAREAISESSNALDGAGLGGCYASQACRAWLAAHHAPQTAPQ